MDSEQWPPSHAAVCRLAPIVLIQPYINIRIIILWPVSFYEVVLLDLIRLFIPLRA